MTSPTNPGDPNNSDEQNLSPNEAEELVEEAAEAQKADSDIDPTVEADVNEALQDLEEEEEIQAAASDAEADEAVAAAEGAAQDDASIPEEEPDLEAQLAERTGDLQRVSAEYANYRRRTERERESIITSAKASVMSELLPILDDLDLARQHGDLEDGPLKTFGEKLTATLSGLKLSAFGAEGEAFDPEIHEAVQDLSSGDEKMVGTVLRKGYRVGDRVIRTAMVIIADAESDDQSDQAVDDNEKE